MNQSLKKLHWSVYLFICFCIGRLLLLCSLYFLNNPYGGKFVDNWTRFFPHTIILDIGVFAVFCLIFKLLKLPRISGIFLLFYMFVIGVDGECVRWISSRLYLSFLQVYINTSTDFSIISKIFMDGFWHFCITISIVLGTFVFYMFIRKYSSSKFSYTTIAAFVIISIVGITSKDWFAPSKNRWIRIAPLVFVYANEINDRGKAQFHESGISLLGGNPQAEYPFWHIQNDDSSYAAFKKMPLENKPDIVILVIESLRGLETDVRDSTICARVPNMCKFSKQGVFFPTVHSVGFPSTEGFIGIQMGLWSHPAKTLIYTHYNILRATPLPKILEKAGYWRAIFTASEPSFDNLQAPFRDWFDYYEYNPKNNEDVPLADSFVAYLSKINRDKPLYITWMSTTTHPPFAVPNGKKGFEEAQHYADSAIGIVLSALEKYRRNETITIIVGDHSYLKPSQNDSNSGNIHSGYTHVPLFIKTPGKQGGEIMDKIVSQVDIAPTILNELGLSVSNCFPGHNLFSDSIYPVFAFRYWDCAIYNYESHECEKAMRSWAWILDNNKLVPPPQ